MKVTIVPIVIDALGTITKGLLKGLGDLEVGGRVETIQMTALPRTVRILRRVMETWGDMLSLRLQWKTIRCRCKKNAKGVNNNRRTCRIEDFIVPADRREKIKENEKRDKYFVIAWLKKAMEHEDDGDTNYNWWSSKGTGRVRNRRTSRNHPTTALIRLARILRKGLDTWGDLLSLKLQWKTIRWCDKFTRCNYNNNDNNDNNLLADNYMVSSILTIY